MKTGKINIIKIAKEANISIATVSRIINNSEKVRHDTRKKVLEIIERTGYRPKIRKNRLKNVLVLVQDKKSVFSQYVSALMNGISDALNALGYEETLIFVNEALHPDIIMETVRERKADSAIVLQSSNNASYLKTFTEEKLPFILVNNAHGSNMNYINTDNRKGMRDALDHLYSLGHRKMMILLDSPQFYDFEERRKAFEEFMEEKGLKDFRVFYLKDFQNYSEMMPAEQGYFFMQFLIKEGFAETAILASDDDVGMGLLRACHENKINVPEHLSIIGFNDFYTSSYLVPSLTTISQDLYKIGSDAVMGLISIMNGKKTLVQNLVPTRLVVRGSTGPINI